MNISVFSAQRLLFHDGRGLGVFFYEHPVPKTMHRIMSLFGGFCTSLRFFSASFHADLECLSKSQRFITSFDEFLPAHPLQRSPVTLETFVHHAIPIHPSQGCSGGEALARASPIDMKADSQILLVLCLEAFFEGALQTTKHTLLWSRQLKVTYSTERTEGLYGGAPILTIWRSTSMHLD